jgi:hypothetical protein
MEGIFMMRRKFAATALAILGTATVAGIAAPSAHASGETSVFFFADTAARSLEKCQAAQPAYNSSWTKIVVPCSVLGYDPTRSKWVSRLVYRTVG